MLHSRLFAGARRGPAAIVMVLVSLQGVAHADANTAPPPAPALDTTFGAGQGYVVTHIGDHQATNFAEAVLHHADGGRTTMGVVATGGEEQLAAIRQLADGRLDASFGTAGHATVSLGGDYLRENFFDDFGAFAGEGPNASTVMAGLLAPSGGLDPADQLFTTRLDADGTLDHSYGTGGVSRVTIGQDLMPGDTLVQVGGVVTPDGAVTFAVRHVAAGMCSADTTIFLPCGPQQFALTIIRVAPDGAPDLSFGAQGVLVVPTPEASIDNAIAVDAQNRIVVVGRSNAYGIYVRRFDADGLPDASFGTGGVALVQPADPTLVGAYAESVTIDETGRIVVAGSTTSVVLARFTPSGAIDDTFGVGGVVSVRLPDYGNPGRIVAKDNEIIVPIRSETPAAPAYVMAFEGDGRGWSRSADLPGDPLSIHTFARPYVDDFDGRLSISATVEDSLTSFIVYSYLLHPTVG